MGGMWREVSPPKSGIYGLGIQCKAYQYASQPLNPRNTLGKEVGWTCPFQSTPWQRPSRPAAECKCVGTVQPFRGSDDTSSVRRIVSNVASLPYSVRLSVKHLRRIYQRHITDGEHSRKDSKEYHCKQVMFCVYSRRGPQVSVSLYIRQDSTLRV